MSWTWTNNKISALQPSPTTRRILKRHFARFSKDEGGQIAIIFALMIVTVVTLVGGAVDYGRWLNARTQTQAAIDSALLAAGRTAQTSSGNETMSLAAANSYYAKMKSNLVVNDSVAFYSANSATSFSAKGSNYINTPFLSIIGIEQLPVLKLGDTVQATATIAQGGNSGSSVEIGLMLDTTGSMSGQKIIDLQTAATELVDIVIWEDQSKYRSRIGIAPFSQAVNVGDYFQSVTNENPLKVTHVESKITSYTDTYGYVYPPSCYTTKTTTKNGVTTTTTTNNCLGQSQYYVLISHTPNYTTTTVTDNYARAKCVVERTGTDEFTDAVPAAGTWLTSLYTAKIKAGSSASSASSATCPEAVPMIPLTNDKTKLKATINSLVAQNSTAGAVGTAWAWYLISPNWGTIFTGDSQPESYSKMTELGTNGQPKLQKIAILMTDGGYNYWQNASASVSTVNPKALSLCSGMKAKGIKVYTVGFDLGTDTTAKTMLQTCATDSTYFYDAANGDALKAAFRDIALKISTLRLSH